MIISCYFLQDGDTPIHLVSRDGHVQVVEKLISLGADVNVVNQVSVNTTSVTKCLICIHMMNKGVREPHHFLAEIKI